MAVILERMTILSRDYQEIKASFKCLSDSFQSFQAFYTAEHIPLVESVKSAHNRITEVTIRVDKAIEDRNRMIDKMDARMDDAVKLYSAEINIINDNISSHNLVHEKMESRMVQVVDRQKITIAILIFIGGSIGTWLISQLLGLIK